MSLDIEPQFGNVLSAVGNHENKALLLGVIQEGIPYSRGDLDRLFRQIQGTPLAWKLSPGLPFKYCENTLSPIGLVAKEILDLDLSTFGFAKTDFGRNFGNPFVGQLLAFSERHPEISLITLFGGTASKRTPEIIDLASGNAYVERPPVVRFRILWQLVTEPSVISSTDLAEAIGQPGNDFLGIGYLRVMSRAGIISYDAIEADEKFVEYKLNDEKPERSPSKYRGQKSDTLEIFEAVLSLSDRNFSIADMMHKLRGNTRYKDTSDENLESLVSRMLNHFKREGFIIRQDKFDSFRQSHVYMTEQQRDMAMQLLNILEGLQQYDPRILREGSRLINEIVNDPARVHNLVKKAKDSSPRGRNLENDDIQALVIKELQAKPGLKSSDLQSLLYEQTGNYVSLSKMTVILETMRISGLVQILRKGSSNHWAISV